MSKTPYQQFSERNGGKPAFREPGKCQNVIHIDANNQRIRMVRIPAKNNLPDLQARLKKHK